jgi:hypothetical protein
MLKISETLQMTRWASITRDEILEFKLQIDNEIQFLIIVY